MSSILDALNKLEQEKAQATHESERPDTDASAIAHDLVGRSMLRDRVTLRITPATVMVTLGTLLVVVVVVTFAAAMFAVRSSERRKSAETPNVQVATAVPPAPTSAAPVEAPAVTIVTPSDKPAAVEPVPADSKPAPAPVASQPVPEAVAPATPKPEPVVSPPVTTPAATAPATTPTFTAPETATSAPSPEVVARQPEKLPVAPPPAPEVKPAPKDEAPSAPAPELTTPKEVPPSTVAATPKKESPPPAKVALKNEDTPVLPRTKVAAKAGDDELALPGAHARTARREDVALDRLPILSPVDQSRYGFDRVKLNMVRPPDEKNPQGSAILSITEQSSEGSPIRTQMRFYEGQRIQQTPLRLFKVETNRVGIEDVRTGDRFQLGFN